MAHLGPNMFGGHEFSIRIEKSHANPGVKPLLVEDHSRYRKWLATMVSFSPLTIGLWDPFQMAFSWLRKMVIRSPLTIRGVPSSK